MDKFGKCKKQSLDWFGAGIAELEPVIEAKQEALVNYKRNPSLRALVILRRSWSVTQIL